MVKTWKGWRDYYEQKRREERKAELRNSIIMWGLWVAVSTFAITLGFVLGLIL